MGHVYAQTYYNCLGECLNDTDSDGVCDELEISGCTDTACNVDLSATEEDGTCIFAQTYMTAWENALTIQIQTEFVMN